MKVTAVRTFLVPPRWLFCKVETDEGVDGWGEPVVEGRAEATAAAVREMSGLLVGEDPLRIQHHWQVLTKGGFYRGGAVLSSAVSGLDQALWDLAGKAYGLPVHRLLGGPVRDRVRLYATLGDGTTEQLQDLAHRHVAAGITAVKITPLGIAAAIETPAQTHDIVRRVELVREAVGDGVDVAVDLHGRCTPAMARRLLPALEHLLPMFVEEPVLPEYAAVLPRIVASTTIPIAVGERLYSRWDFAGPLDAGVAVVQPDPSHAGGISECHRIAALAELHGAQVAPHCPLGPLALAACLQLDLAVPNTLLQEHALGLHTESCGRVDGVDALRYLADPGILHAVDGHVPCSDKPGLGVVVDEAAVRHAAESPHAWRSPVWFHDDGSFAEW
jgi:galactonate dehydratase